MTTPQALAGEDRRLDRLALVLALFALLLAPLGLLAAKAVVPLVLAAAIAGGLVAGPAARPWRVLDGDLATAVGALAVWCLIASAWSFDPVAAATLALRIALLLAAMLYLAVLAQRLEEAQRRPLRLAFCIGFAVTFVLLAIDLAFGGPIIALLHGAAAARDDPWRLNRGISALAILVWPLAALAWQRGRLWLARALPTALLGLTLFASSSASVVALSAGLLAAVLAGTGRTMARAVMILAVVVTLFGSPFAAGLAQQVGLTTADWLADSARYRLHIWTVVSERIAERPLFGWGFDASPDLPVRDAQPFEPGAKIIPSHPHNGALQIMVETGIVGSLLTLALLLLLTRRIDALPASQRAAAVAMLVTVLGIAATAYGIWQSHWLAMIGAAAAVFIALQPAAERTKPARPSSG